MALIGTHKHRLAILAIGLFGLVGSYWVFSSNANPQDVYFDDGSGVVSRSAGEIYDLVLYADMPAQAVNGEVRLGIGFAKGTASVSYLGYSPGSAGGYGPGQALNTDGTRVDHDVDTCINVYPSKFGASHVPVATVHLKAIQAGSYSKSWSFYSTWNCSGDASNAEVPNNGTAPATPPSNTNGNTSAGGGGSIANTPSNQPNTTPSSSSQGAETKQPELEPSPFYDGKLYEPASDPIDETIGNISVGGRKIAHGWLYLMAFGIAGSAGGLYFWRWKHGN